MSEPQSSKTVAALFVRRNSIYKTIPGVDCWDQERDARKWPGGCAVIAHPPCAQWGQLRHMATVNPAEKALALLSVDLVRRWGGVLEHPARSDLWRVAELPQPGERDPYGGWTFTISQKWFGHRAEKPTWLYIVGTREIPLVPYTLGESPAVCGRTGRDKTGFRNQRRPEITKTERSGTPIDLAHWLVEVARRSGQLRVAA